MSGKRGIQDKRYAWREKEVKTRENVIECAGELWKKGGEGRDEAIGRRYICMYTEWLYGTEGVHDTDE